MKLTLALILPALALAQERAKFTGQFTAQGSGCPPNSVSVALSGSNETASVTLRSYRAEVGPNIPPTEQNKQCQVFLQVRFPLGCTSIAFVNTLNGSVSLDPTATGEYQRNYVLPSGRDIVGNNPPPLRFVAPAGPNFVQVDRVSARVPVDGEAQRLVPFSLEGGLALQRGANNNARGTLGLDTWVVNINEQSTQPGRC